MIIFVLKDTFNVILDKLDSELRKSLSYEKIKKKLSVNSLIRQYMNNRKIRNRSKCLRNAYVLDLESALDDEFVHFHAY